MSTSITFIGTGFFVVSAVQSGFNTITVTFSSTPKAASSIAVDDALNPVNYVLSGPGPYSIASITPTSGDPLSVNILLNSALAAGTWAITAANIQTPTSFGLGVPDTAQFQVVVSSTLTPLTAGAENDDAEKVIRKHLSPALRGPNWDALIAALSVGDDMNWDNARAAFDQLYLSTASGSYLTRRAADQGIQKPYNVGISDDDFRQLAIKTTAGKLVHQSLREILEVYYGRDSLRAFVETELDEKFNLTGNPTLTWKLDEKEEFSHTFTNAQFGVASAARAIEVAAALTKTMRDRNSEGFAIANVASDTGLPRVRIYSGSLGLGSSVRVTGGTAQNILRFPSHLEVYSGTVSTGTGYNWVFTQINNATTRMSLTINTGSTPRLIDISPVYEGDYMVMGPDAQTGQTGTFQVKQAKITWSGVNVTQTIDLETIPFTGTALQASQLAYTFYRPTRKTTAVGSRSVIVAQTQPGSVDITIPATTAVATRTPGHAAYLRSQPEIDVARVQRLPSGLTRIFTRSAHGLTSGNVGQQIRLDDIQSRPVAPFITPGNAATVPSQWLYSASHCTIAASTQVPPGPTEGPTATLLTNGQILFAGGYTTASGVYDFARNFCKRYQSGSQSTIIDGTEADGALQHSHTWVATTALNAARHKHAASTYGTGALVSGGVNTALSILSSAETYLLGGGWTTTSAMASARAGHQQQETGGGLVAVAGGATTYGRALNTTEFFDGSAWVPGPSMSTRRVNFQLVRLSNGHLLAIGGRTLGQGHLVDPDTLALWRLDETSGTTAAEATGTYPLTYTGSPAPFAQGKVDGALDFNAGGSYVSGAGNAAAATALRGPWTLEAWFKRSTTAAGVIATFGGPTEASAENILLKLGIDGSQRLYWKWEYGGGVDVTATLSTALPSLPAYRAGEFNHVALRKTLSGLDYSGKTQGWMVGDLILGMTSGALATVTAVDGGFPGGATGIVRVVAKNNKAFVASENLRIIPSNNLTVDPTLLTNAAAVVAPLYTVDIFINGFKYGTWTDQVNSSAGGNSTWQLAQDIKTSVGFPGILDDVRVSKVARTDSEIAQNFLRGWGNYTGVEGGDAVGEITPECELFDGVSWTKVPQMGTARAYHQATVLPGDYVLVTGGLGYDQTQLRTHTGLDVMSWPANYLSTAEVRDPVTGVWSYVEAAGVARHSHTATYVPAIDSVAILGGTAVADSNTVEFFSVKSKTWRRAPTTTSISLYPGAGALGGSEVVMLGGNDGTATNTSGQAIIVGGMEVSSGGLNDSLRITAVPSATEIVVSTTATPNQTQYTSTLVPAKTISTGSRTSNLTTLVLTTAHDIAVGDLVYVNSRTGAFGAGLKTVLSVSSNTITYAETASNQTSISVVGSVSTNQAPTARLVRATAPDTPTGSPGPFLLDPVGGLAVTGTEALTAGFSLSANQQYEEIELDAGGDDFPEEGYVVLGFGYSNQTPPVKYLRKYKSGPTTTNLVLDYKYRFAGSFPIGSTVTLLTGRSPYNPETTTDGFWLTASNSGRVAAQASAEAAMAAGVDSNITITYPGDRGLGAEGYPASGAQKLSDKVRVFAGDEVEAEVQLRREE